MNRLRSLRALYGLTQLDMAKLLKMSVESYKMKEEEKTFFKLKEICKIVEIFKLSSEDIYDIFFKNELHKMSSN